MDLFHRNYQIMNYNLVHLTSIKIMDLNQDLINFLKIDNIFNYHLNIHHTIYDHNFMATNQFFLLSIMSW